MLLTTAADGVHIAVRLTPQARAERLDGVEYGRLKILVTAAPAENRANEALLRLLACLCRLPRRDLSIILGSKSRNKVVRVAGEPTELMRRLTPLISGESG